MGLEGTDQPLMRQGSGHIQQGVQLVGVMGVVVVHLSAVALALVLEAPLRAPEGGKALRHRPVVDAQHIGRRRGSQRIGNVVSAGNVQLHMRVALALRHHVKAGEAVEKRHVVGVHVSVPVLHAEPVYFAAQIRQRFPRAAVIAVGDHKAVLGRQAGKLAEGVLDLPQIAEKVQVIRRHVQNHRHGGEEIQEGIAVFAAFQNNGVAFAHPVALAQQGQGSADHDRGILLRRHKDVGGHGGGGGLAMGAGDAQGVAVRLHDGAPALGPLIDRDPPGNGPGDLGIAVVNGSGADHQIAVLQILGAVADGHGDPHTAQMLHRVAVGHIGALYRQPHALEHLRQRAHGYAADTCHMDTDAGMQKMPDILSGMCHINSSKRAVFHAAACIFLEKIL